MNLKNKKVLITGSTGGIGNSIVSKFYDHGSLIFATGTKEEKLNNLKSKNINCFSNEGDNWGNPNISVNENNVMKISFREKFTFRRGRLNCSLNENGKWKWFGHQFTVQIPK